VPDIFTEILKDPEVSVDKILEIVNNLAQN
jgi:hypothetical protein